MTTTDRRRFLTLASAALAAPALSRSAFADAWPKDRAIRAVVPFTGKGEALPQDLEPVRELVRSGELPQPRA